MLLHALDILNHIGFDKDSIWADGYKSFCPDIGNRVYKNTTHNEPHGTRCYDLLMEVPTDRVIIMDSDFFCTDKNFWKDVKIKLEEFSLISIKDSWLSFPYTNLTTPFVAYNKKVVLEYVPYRDLWNHFGVKYPKMPDPLFDHMKFVFLVALNNKFACAIDSWDLSERKYGFCHLWDSRHSYSENFEAFNNSADASRYRYIAYGVSKYIFDYSLTGHMPIDHRLHYYVDEIVKNNNRALHDIRDTLLHLGDQFICKEHFDRFMEIRSVITDRNSELGLVP